ncbi:MAG: hypothetical protein J5554_13995 [Paludibacteraceae bacterium]|nr:hypothetical protein [Paludibacteraceae bacterium]
MNRKQIITGLSFLTFCVASIADTPRSMQVWLKSGEQKVFDLTEVDSVTFVENFEEDSQVSLTENTFPPIFEKPCPLEVSSTEKSFVKTTNEFGQKCFSLICTENSREPIKFFSPISLNMALGYCANGATNQGAKEIAYAMGFTSDNALSDMNDFFQKVYLSINSNVDSVEIHTANALWLNEKSVANKRVVNIAREKYYSTVRTLNFLEDPKGSLDTINHWASLMTNDRINDLDLKIDDHTRFVINNACYFKGDWVQQFSPYEKVLFTGADGKSDSTDFMRIVNTQMEYSETDDYQVVKLDYGKHLPKDTVIQDSESSWSGATRPAKVSSSAYSMVLLLPKSGHSLGEILPTFKWDEIPFSFMEGNVYMPKFQANGGYELDEILKKLSIGEIFNEFPNIVISGPTPFITQVRQDFFVNVDEIGTEAAAVTSIVGGWGGAVMKTFTMFCDRPFAFAIRENKSGLLLFMGEYDAVP